MVTLDEWLLHVIPNGLIEVIEKMFIILCFTAQSRI